MKLKIDTKKGAEAVSGFLQKTSEIGKKAAEELQKGATTITEKAQQESYQRRLKKYNPLFPDVYHSADFNLPNMIVIVDDAIRRDIDVCKGAIGWRGTENDIEVLYLYDEAVKSSGIQFIPSVTCDAVYYVDCFNRNRFIRLDCIFNKAHEERLAELKHVAHSLGAKLCSIEISESTHTVNFASKSISGNEKLTTQSNAKVSSNFEQTASYNNPNQRSGKITAEFEGNSEPKRPKLKWFAHEESIKKLIDMRCKGDNSVKVETLELSGSSSATMSQKTAYAIDGAISKMSFKNSLTMENQAIAESSSKLIFHIEF